MVSIEVTFEGKIIWCEQYWIDCNINEFQELYLIDECDFLEVINIEDKKIILDINNKIIETSKNKLLENTDFIISNYEEVKEKKFVLINVIFESGITKEYWINCKLKTFELYTESERGIKVKDEIGRTNIIYLNKVCAYSYEEVEG